MIRRYGAELRTLLMMADFASTAILAIGISALMFGANATDYWSMAVPDPLLALALYSSAWVAALWVNGAHRLRARWSIEGDVRVVLRSMVWFGFATLAFLYVARLPEVSRPYIAVLFIAQFATTVLVRVALRRGFGVARQRGMNNRNVLILGTGPTGRDFAQKLEEHPELGLQVVGFLGDRTDELPARWSYLGPIESLPDVAHEHVVDEVVIALVTEDWRLIESVAAMCEVEGKQVRMPVPMPQLSIATAHVEDLDGMPVLSLLTGPNAAVALWAKRAIDVVVATLGMIILGPLLIVIAIAIKATDGGPVLYLQERVGLQGRRFRVIKFRSMVQNADAMMADLEEHNEVKGQAFKMTRDPRITRFGHFLRRSSLDELPQLWNVVRGEMSLVGPRPPLPSEVAAYDVWHRRRLSMKPGITGLWQIEGRNEPEFDRWVEKDLQYIDHWSPWLDISIMIRTIPAVLRASGR